HVHGVAPGVPEVGERVAHALPAAPRDRLGRATGASLRVLAAAGLALEGAADLPRHQALDVAGDLVAQPLRTEELAEGDRELGPRVVAREALVHELAPEIDAAALEVVADEQRREDVLGGVVRAGRQLLAFEAQPARELQ